MMVQRLLLALVLFVSWMGCGVRGNIQPYVQVYKEKEEIPEPKPLPPPTETPKKKDTTTGEKKK